MSFFIDTGNEIESPATSLNSRLRPEIANIVESVLNNTENCHNNKNIDKTEKKTSLVDEFIRNLDTINNKQANNLKKYDADFLKEENTTNAPNRINKLLEKSVIHKPEFDLLHKVPSNNISDKKLKKIRKFEQQKTKGDKWFNLPATEITEEVKRDLEVLQMRSVLDPKHFYKKNDLKVLPKYFQIGKVMDSPLDYYNNRLTKKERKRTLVDELLANSEFKKYNKKKFVEIVEQRRKTNYKAYQTAKKLKRKNKK